MTVVGKTGIVWLVDRVLIILDQKDGYPERRGYAIWTLADLWRDWGIRVEVYKGIDQPPEADLVFPHIDRTIVPQPYRDFLERQPRVVNRGVYDISKRTLSTLLIGPTDDYEGPVIVKTNFNSGGLAERYPGSKRRSTIGDLGQRALRKVRLRREPDLATATAIQPRKYPIFESIDDLPREVFGNDSLIVERFLPEREGELFVMRAYHFLGDAHTCRRIGSRLPIVKEKDSVINEEIPPHDEIVALRRQLGLDYAKIDYVVHDDRVTLLDVNPTVGLSLPKFAVERASILAPGIRGFLGREGERP